MGGSTQKAPSGFQPPNQAGAATGFQQGTQQLSKAGQQLYNTTSPELQQVVSNVTNNPYYGQAQAGAQAAAAAAQGQVVPSMLAGAGQDTGVANAATAAIPGYTNAAMGAGQQALNTTNSFIPTATAGAGLAAPVFNQAESFIPPTTMPELQAGGQVLNTGFDPQNALYGRTYQQMLDQNNAALAANGVAGSPYAAGVTGENLSNFNIDWQNNLLSRQIAALNAYNGAASTAAGNFSELQNTGVNNFNNLTNSATGNLANLVNTGTGALNAGINTAVGAQTNLGNQAIAGNQASSQLGQDAVNLQAQAAQLPYDLSNQQQQAQLAAILAQISGTNASLAPTQQAVSDYGNYLNIGQGATRNAIEAAQVNNQAAANSAAGIGNLFGDVLGMFSFSPIKL